MESAPTVHRGDCIFPGGRRVSPVRRAGVHARRTVDDSKPGTFTPPRGLAGRGHPALRSPGRPRQSRLAGRSRTACRGGACPSRKPRAAANTPCRGRFHIGPACPAAYPRGRAMALPYKPGQTLRPPGLPETKNLPVGAGFIPPAEPRAAANRADMESAPTVHRGGCIFPGGREPRPIPNSSFLIPNFSPLSRPPDTIRTHPRGRMGASETKRRKRGASR